MAGMSWLVVGKRVPSIHMTGQRDDLGYGRCGRHEGCVDMDRGCVSYSKHQLELAPMDWGCTRLCHPHI